MCTLWAQLVLLFFSFLKLCICFVYGLMCVRFGHSTFFSPDELRNFGDLRCSKWVLREHNFSIFSSFLVPPVLFNHYFWILESFYEKNCPRLSLKITYLTRPVDWRQTLWRRYDIRKFDADAIFFREIQCKKRDILLIMRRFQCGLGWNQVK